VSCPIYVAKGTADNANTFFADYYPGSNFPEVSSKIGGLYATEPYFENDELKSKRVIFMPHISNDFSEYGAMSCLVHEICHLIKGYKDEFHIGNDGFIHQRSGIARYRLEMVKRDDRIHFENVDRYAIHFEEGSNAYDEQSIMSIIKGEPYQISSDYKILVGGIDFINRQTDILEQIQNDQLYGTNNLKNKLGEADFMFLVDIFERIYTHQKKCLSLIVRGSTEEKEQANRQLNDVCGELVSFCNERQEKGFQKGS